MPKKEESLIEEMRAAIARDRERLTTGSPVAVGTVEEPQPEPPAERPSLLDRLLGRRPQ